MEKKIPTIQERKLSAMRRKLMNYDRRMFVFMKKAAIEEISMELESHGKAVHLRQQMYRMRKLMRDMDHEDSPLIEGMSLKVMDTGTGAALLIGTPTYTKWDNAFKKAGIEDDYLQETADETNDSFDISHLVEGDSPTPPVSSTPEPDIPAEGMSHVKLTRSPPAKNKANDPDFSDAARPYAEDKE